MTEVSPAWVVTAISTLGAIIMGFLTFKSSKAQAQPNAQDAINAGFTKLAERQDRELEKIGERLTLTEQAATTAKAEAEMAKRLAEDEHDRLNLAVDSLKAARNWHIRHATKFDQPVIKVLEEVAPDRVAPLVERIESDPFPQLPDEL